MIKRAASSLSISAALLLAISGTPAFASGEGIDPVDLSSQYPGEEFTDDLVIEDYAGDPEGPTPRSAYGSSPIQTFEYQIGGFTLSIPTGCALTHGITGSGRTISRQIAGVDCVGPTALVAKFCNTRLEFHYANTSNKTYKIVRGPLNTTCRTGTVNTYTVSKQHTLPHYGKGCAQLFVNGVRRAVQCHFITS
ncbi:hypothetical protein [Streptomyces sp. NPDC058861]|uniref:hypothetical protein n=1 Tax=Streptomyces sp. NPDC058861 TaxID=3346653 RepID=UPI00369C762F